MAVERIYRTGDRREFTDPREAQEHQNMLDACEALSAWGERYLTALPPETRRMAINIMWDHRSELFDLLMFEAGDPNEG